MELTSSSMVAQEGEDDVDASGSAGGCGDGSFGGEGESPGNDVDGAGVVVVEDEFLSEELTTRGGRIVADDEFLGVCRTSRGNGGRCGAVVVDHEFLGCGGVGGGVDNFVGEY